MKRGADDESPDGGRDGDGPVRCAGPAGPWPSRRRLAAQPYFTLDTKIADIFADPNARTVFGEFFRKRGGEGGRVSPRPRPREQANTAQIIKNFTPRQLAAFPQAISTKILGSKALGEALAKVPAPATPATPAAN